MPPRIIEKHKSIDLDDYTLEEAIDLLKEFLDEYGENAKLSISAMSDGNGAADLEQMIIWTALETPAEATARERQEELARGYAMQRELKMLETLKAKYEGNVK